MAFRDANGRITIDEVAAQKDINAIRAAMEHLSTADNLLTHMIHMASEFSGETGKALVDTCAQLQKQIRSLNNFSENATIAIDKTIKKYEQIDRELKELINNYSQS